MKMKVFSIITAVGMLCGYAWLESDSSKIKMATPNGFVALTDKELSDVYAGGFINLSFHNTEVSNQEAVVELTNLLNQYFGNFPLEYDVNIYGATYPDGVKPVEYDQYGRIIMHLPNMEKVEITGGLNTGKVVLTGVDFSGTIITITFRK